MARTDGAAAKKATFTAALVSDIGRFNDKSFNESQLDGLKRAKKALPGTKVFIGYSQDLNAIDKCKTVAQNLISRGAQVLFQVAGNCGQGTLQAADQAGIWGIGVDKDQYNDARRVLTSGVKRVDNGVFQAIQQAKAGNFQGGTDL